ncbi:Hpt domain-containing protein [Candidatus Woesearchaeota archaeon]|nr:Hpt domain-containing protein [Candidatus Woesearchaeota archaeon]
MNPSDNTVNLEQALELAGGDQELLDMILHKFWLRYPELLAGLRQALESGDLTAGRDAAHSLKSNAAYLCAAEVRECAREIEQAFRDGQPEKARLHFAALETAGERLRVHPAIVAALK